MLIIYIWSKKTKIKKNLGYSSEYIQDTSGSQKNCYFGPNQIIRVLFNKLGLFARSMKSNWFKRLKQYNSQNHMRSQLELKKSCPPLVFIFIHHRIDVRRE